MEAVKGQHYFKDMDFYIQETPSVLLKVGQPEEDFKGGAFPADA